VEALRWAVSLACTPFYYALDWLFNTDHEFEQLIAEQQQRLIDQSFDNE
jgi:hypothetical protein